MSAPSLTQVHRQFEAALPTIDTTLRFQFKDLPRDRREEAIADARAAVWSSWASLIARGKDPLEVGVVGIATRCCLYTRGGRKVGNRNVGRGCPDIQDPRVRRKTGLRVVSLEDAALPAGGTWRQWLQDHRIGPADAACFSIDFEEWLSGLPERKRRIAELLAQDHETGVVAGLMRVTPAAISQTRTWLESSWQAFQGELGAASAPSERRGRGRPRKCVPRIRAASRAEVAAS
jgi:hypothetical protein